MISGTGLTDGPTFTISLSGDTWVAAVGNDTYAGYATTTAALLASMLRRRLESPTWYLWSLLTESRSAPLTASISIEFSSNTSIGVCAFHVGILYGRE